MKLTCKRCQAPIASEHVNMKEGLCHCPHCDEFFRIAERLGDDVLVGQVEKPARCNIASFIEKDSLGFILPPQGWRGPTFFFLFFTAFWNAISWTMFVIALREGELFGTLFLLPFLLIGAVTFGVFLFFLKGEFSLLIENGVCTGLWTCLGLRRQKSFPARDITGVGQEEIYRQNDRPVYGIGVRHGEGKVLKFGASLREDERRWLLSELQQFLQRQPRY